MNVVFSLYLYEKEDAVDTKPPEGFVSFYELLLSEQLRVIRQLKAPKTRKPKSKNGELPVTHIHMALDILQRV